MQIGLRGEPENMNVNSCDPERAGPVELPRGVDPNDATPIEALDLSVRSRNGLRRAGVDTVGKLAAYADLRDVYPSMGRACAEEIRKALCRYLADPELGDLCRAVILRALDGVENAEDTTEEEARETLRALKQRGGKQNGG